MRLPNDDWKFPEVFMGQGVIVSADPSQTDHVFGWVVKVKSRAIDVVCIYPERIMYRLDVLHVDDPQVPMRPDIFNDGYRGVFRLTDREERLTELDKIATDAQVKMLQHLAATNEKVEAIEGHNEQLVLKLSELEAEVESLKTRKRTPAKASSK
jgi:hypothetical protein